MKKNDYLCPKCKGHLNVGSSIIFSTSNKRQKKGLILLNPTIGDYTYEHHDNYIFEEGEMIEFFCPICQAELKSAKNHNFASIIMIDHGNIEYEILFSRKAGEKSTYVLSNEELETFGDDAKDYDEVFDD
ncbi:MAG: hypothetical protein ABII90_06120 [Bacteroidota bacterium]